MEFVDTFLARSADLHHRIKATGNDSSACQDRSLFFERTTIPFRIFIFFPEKHLRKWENYNRRTQTQDGIALQNIVFKFAIPHARRESVAYKDKSHPN